jgi:type IV pilus assembly protein PilX
MINMRQFKRQPIASFENQPFTRSIGMQSFTRSPVIATTQSGAVLVISLIFLLLLTLVGVSGSQMTSMEEKMSGNSKNHNLAFQAAESALRAGETAIATLPTSALYSGTVSEINWSNDTTGKVQTYNGGSLYGVIQPPKYVVTYLSSTTSLASSAGSGDSMEAGGTLGASSENWYVITARGYGGTANSIVTLQSVYKR